MRKPQPIEKKMSEIAIVALRVSSLGFSRVTWYFGCNWTVLIFFTFYSFKIIT
jgi:hypothetical protein